YDDAPPNAGTAGARTACGHLSVDPDMVGSGTETRGHGWLALTSPHAGHGAFPSEPSSPSVRPGRTASP
ncbi:hypothetical protein ACFWY6_13375, partial [Streptomyces sp. NPDC059037]